MPSAGFEPATPATKRPQTYALDRAATEVGLWVLSAYKEGLCIYLKSYMELWNCMVGKRRAVFSLLLWQRRKQTPFCLLIFLHFVSIVIWIWFPLTHKKKLITLSLAFAVRLVSTAIVVCDVTSCVWWEFHSELILKRCGFSPLLQVFGVLICSDTTKEMSVVTKEMLCRSSHVTYWDSYHSC
jgi:hypothetical protein